MAIFDSETFGDAQAAGGSWLQNLQGQAQGAGGFNNLVLGSKGEGYAQSAVNYFNKALAPFFEAGKSESDLLFGSAQATQKALLPMIQEGYGNARANLGELSRVGSQGIMDAQTQALGASQQAAISSGLSGSTAHGAANRGIASDTARSIANLQGTIGQLYSSLDVGQAGMEAQVGQGLAGILQNQAGAAQNFTGLAFSGLNQTPIDAPQDSGFGSILGGLLGGLGSYFGAKA